MNHDNTLEHYRISFGGNVTVTHPCGLISTKFITNTGRIFSNCAPCGLKIICHAPKSFLIWPTGVGVFAIAVTAYSDSSSSFPSELKNSTLKGIVIFD